MCMCACAAHRKLSSSYPLLHKKTVVEQEQPVSKYAIANMFEVGPWHAETMSFEQPFQSLVVPPFSVQQSVIQWRKSAVDALANCLQAESLAAEYVFLAIISHVVTRTESMTVGNLSINLTHTDAALVQQLAQIVAELVPRTVLMELTVENLNQGRLHSKKDYNRNRLKPSALQLQAGTVLIVDETCMNEGQLTEVGVADLQSLGKVIQEQKLPIDFEYYNVDFHTDLPIISCSTNKPLVSAHISVRFAPEGLLTTNCTQDDLKAFRLLIALCRTADPILSADFCKLAEDDFVAARRADKAIQQQDFHTWLTLARLMAASCGADTVLPEHWERIRTLETARLMRVATPEVKTEQTHTAERSSIQFLC